MLPSGAAAKFLTVNVEQSSHAESPNGRLTLRHNYLSAIENTAQTLGGMAPTGTLGIVLPLLIAAGGNASWLFFSITLLAFSLILISINRFAAQSASAGALATFAREGLGRGAELAAGWSYVAAMLFSAASVAPSAAFYADLVIKQATGAQTTVLRSCLLTAGVVALAWMIAYRDIKLSTKIMLLVELGSLAVMVFIVAVAMIHTGAWVDRPQMEFRSMPLGGAHVALLLGFVTLAGFESVTTLGEESRHAKRTIPRAIVTCLVPMGLLYLAMIYCLVALARRNGIVLESLIAPFDTIARSLRLPAVGYLSSAGVALSYFGCTLATVNAGARVLFSMARDGLFAPKFGLAHPVNATPHRAIALISVAAIVGPVAMLAAGVSLWDCVNYGTQLTSFGFVGSYFVVCLALPFYLRRRGTLRARDVAIAGGALVILCAVLAFSVFPAPAAPWRYLPYIFLAFVILGAAYSMTCRRKILSSAGVGANANRESSR
ncbi:MAG: APC family permease [Candidatus Acidiferrales bacterium]